MVSALSFVSAEYLKASMVPEHFQGAKPTSVVAAARDVTSSFREQRLYKTQSFVLEIPTFPMSCC